LSSLYGFANDGVYNYILDNTNSLVYKFSSSWVYLSQKSLPFSSPLYLTYVNGYWFITGNNGIYKMVSTFSNIQYSATTGGLISLCYHSPNFTIFAIKTPNYVIEYTPILTVFYTNTISGYYLWSITASGNTLYISTDNGLVLVMTNRVVTGFFDACRQMSR